MPHSGCSLTEPVDLPTMLKSGLGRSPDAPALMSLDETWSWSELDRATSRLAAHYLALGLKPGAASPR
jgi:acyl-CoA synthetase (AMP-forming)/AMP-acid ligase II